MQTRLRCIVFRTGGTENFQWHRSLSLTEDDAMITLIMVRRMGYCAYNVSYDLSINIGLPETFEYSLSDNPNEA